ncbi:MAG: YicC family protein [Spirochaetes bacterium GWF1_31_7]|nr:MAG: YicC family protein [Spirochaetes bacterium GWE1_32_154]OHD45238.1 MAG: YicC family protein [Spirochaetes bacterium GWE2_31_10]OHD50533.1 MAG: YicC family protein [Spirochaetes bacterium GWF1_31_7]OHD79146.1 MAG: YicC family protein [Spirochaetes bacterium RIFOXYB1_FULL_32_8]HBD94183.1 YicC family protein [Spirochaetia bacterium]
MNGMTGYSYKENYYDEQYLTTEIKTVNHRFLDVFVHLPSFLSPLEMSIKELISSSFTRGKIEVSVYLRLKDTSSTVTPNLELARQYCDSLKKIIETCGLNDSVQLSHLIKYQDILVSDSKRDYESYWKWIKESIEGNIQEVNSMRSKEGDSTKVNVLFLLKEIEEALETVFLHVPEMEKLIFNCFNTKMTELVGEVIDADRVLNEVGVLVSKSCVNEEIERFKHHIKHFYKIIESNTDVGKKLDFVCQEMHREANTLGSKAVLPSITEFIIIIKNNIEKIREQIRNIE